jgi:D-alanyl-D-alanine carboxypeptidase
LAVSPSGLSGLPVIWTRPPTLKRLLPTELSRLQARISLKVTSMRSCPLAIRLLLSSMISSLFIGCSRGPALCPCSITSARTSPASTSAEADKVDDYVKSEMAKRHIPGASVVVIRNGRVILASNYGQANIELSVPVTPDSVFKLASLTKPFTATAIMILVEERKISLDDRIAEYLPGLPSQWANVTIRQALSHTSGVTDYLQAPRWSWQSSWRQDLTPEEFIKFASEAPPLFAPGEGIRYSNTGFYLLGMVIQKVSGKPYGQFLAERIFRPLQMTASKRDSLTEIVPNRVNGYVFSDGTLRNAEYTSETWAYSEGGIISTAADLAKYEAALDTEKILKQSSLEQMWTPSKLNDGRLAIIGDNGAGKPNYYGLGWFISEHRGHKIIFHPGDKPGFSSTFTRFVDERLTVLLLCNNSSDSPAFAMSLGIADLFLGISNPSTK